MATSATTKRRAFGVSTVFGVALLLAACATSSSGQSPSGNAFSPHASVRGQHITVLLPYPVSQKILKQFTQQTGVTLTYETLRAEALPRTGSLKMLEEVARTWT